MTVTMHIVWILTYRFASDNDLNLLHINLKGFQMSTLDELILRSTKEIVVKFIETGRVGPAAFDELFKAVYKTVEQTVKGVKEDSEPSE